MLFSKCFALSFVFSSALPDSEFSSLLQSRRFKDRKYGYERTEQKFWASPNGDSSKDGRLESEPTSLRNCVESALSHDGDASCVLLPGRYRDNVDVTISPSKPGTKTIMGSDTSNRPILDGTETIAQNEWSYDNLCDCWTADFTGTDQPWQLFKGTEGFLPARWPNADGADGPFAEEAWARSASTSIYKGPNMCAKEKETGKTCSESYGKFWDFDGTINGCYKQTMECSNMQGKSTFVPMPGPADSTMVDVEWRGNGGLKAQGFNDLTGATVVANIGHWTTYATEVTSWNSGAGEFDYRSRYGWNLQKYKAEDNIYFLENHLDLLDVAGEWHFDANANKLYVKTGTEDNGNGPKPNDISVRVRDYALNLKGTPRLRIQNVAFFAATFAVLQASKNDDYIEKVEVDNCRFDYSAASKRILGDYTWSSPTTVYNHKSSRTLGVTSSIKNCEFRSLEGTVTLDLSNPGWTISNNLFDGIDYTATNTITYAATFYTPGCRTETQDTPAGCFYSPMTLSLPTGTAANPTIIEKNTIKQHGASNAVHLNWGLSHDSSNADDQRTIIRLNIVSNKHSLQMDGGLISLPTKSAKGTEVSQNWCYSAGTDRHYKTGLRNDRGQSECGGTWGVQTEWKQNVVWGTSGVTIKGNNHVLERNVVFGSSFSPQDDPNALLVRDDILLYGSTGGVGTCECSDSQCQSSANANTCCVANDPNTYENKLTSVIRNIVDSARDTSGGSKFYPSTQAVDDAFKGQGITNVVDNSAGAVQEELADPANFDFRPLSTSAAAQCNRGAYEMTELNAGKYWIPGYRDTKATFPVPPNGVDAVVHDVSDVKLMFKPARGAVSHLVFCAETEADLTSMDNSQGMSVSGDVNMVQVPFTVTLDNPVFWRVDAVFAPNIIERSTAVWQFTPKSPPPIDLCSFEQRSGNFDLSSSFAPGPDLQMMILQNFGRPTWYQIDTFEVCFQLTALPVDNNWHRRFIIRLTVMGSNRKAELKPASVELSAESGTSDLKYCFRSTDCTAEPSLKYCAGGLVGKGPEWLTLEEYTNVISSGATKVGLLIKERDPAAVVKVSEWSLKACFSNPVEQSITCASSSSR